MGGHTFPDYPYRNDAKLVWNAIHDWTTAYVNVYYHGDDDVTGDLELAEWTHSLKQEGRIEGFKTITTREQLSEVLTMVIFTSSAQHAAVNFPQKFLMSYAPAISGAVWGKDPAGAESETEWLKLFPPLPLSWQPGSRRDHIQRGLKWK